LGLNLIIIIISIIGSTSAAWLLSQPGCSDRGGNNFASPSYSTSGSSSTGETLKSPPPSTSCLLASTTSGLCNSSAISGSVPSTSGGTDYLHSHQNVATTEAGATNWGTSDTGWGHGSAASYTPHESYGYVLYIGSGQEIKAPKTPHPCHLVTLTTLHSHGLSPYICNCTMLYVIM
jgi:hypothetical protein